MQKLNGYVKIYRKLVQWGWYKDFVVKDVFLHILFTASFRESEWMGRTIKPGQLVTSYGSLAQQTGFSVQRVRTAIYKLKSTNEITCETTNKFTIITVTNWEEYQAESETETNKSTQSATIHQQTINKQLTNNQQHLKNVKNVKNVKNNTRAREDVLSDEERKAIIAELRR